MYYYDSDEGPVYALVHVDDILIVGVTTGYSKMRNILGERFIVKDIGDLNSEGYQLDFSDEFSSD